MCLDDRECLCVLGEGGSSFVYFQVCEGQKRGWSHLHGSHFPTITEAAPFPARAIPVSSLYASGIQGHSQNLCLGARSVKSRGGRSSFHRGFPEAPSPLHPAITSSRRNLGPSLVSTIVIDRNQPPKTPLDQPRSPGPLFPDVCVWRTHGGGHGEMEHLCIREWRSSTT